MDAQHATHGTMEPFQFSGDCCQQIHFSIPYCGFDACQSKASPYDWTDSDGRSPLSNSSYWEEALPLEHPIISGGQTYDGFPRRQDGFNGSRPFASCAASFSCQEQTRQFWTNGWGEFQKAKFHDDRCATFAGSDPASSGGKTDVFLRDATEFREPAGDDFSPTSEPYQPYYHFGSQCSYSSQIQTCSPVNGTHLARSNELPSYAATASLDLSLNAKKKKRKREINKVQRQAANLRERKRMNRLNNAFDQLWQKMPKQAFGQFSKNLSSQIKFSRVFILRSALCYIEYLKGLLDGKIEVNPDQLPPTLRENI